MLRIALTFIYTTLVIYIFIIYIGLPLFLFLINKIKNIIDHKNNNIDWKDYPEIQIIIPCYN